MPKSSNDRTVLLATRDLVFRAKLEQLLAACGWRVTQSGRPPHAIVELSDQTAIRRVRALVDGGTRVLAFGPHVRADWLRAAREAGAAAVPNAQIVEAVRQRFAPAVDSPPT